MNLSMMFGGVKVGQLRVWRRDAGDVTGDSMPSRASDRYEAHRLVNGDRGVCG